MAFKFRRSSVAGRVPATTDLVPGEIALNTTDGKLYFKKTVNSVDSIVELQQVTAGTGLSLNSSTGSISINSTIVTLDGTQTLTNKTLTTPRINSSTSQWIFNANGNLTLPTGGDIVDSHGTSVLGGVSALYSVRYDINDQGLTLTEQENARTNINAISTEDAFIFSLIM